MYVHVRSSYSSPLLGWLVDPKIAVCDIVLAVFPAGGRECGVVCCVYV